jgi:hypothetical protein
LENVVIYTEAGAREEGWGEGKMVFERQTSIAIEHALDLLQVLADLFAGLGGGGNHIGAGSVTDAVFGVGCGHTFFLGSPGGADSSLRMLSRRPRTRSVGVRCFVLKKFMGSALREKGRLNGGCARGSEGRKEGAKKGEVNV